MRLTRQMVSVLFLALVGTVTLSDAASLRAISHSRGILDTTIQFLDTLRTKVAGKKKSSQAIFDEYSSSTQSTIDELNAQITSAQNNLPLWTAKQKEVAALQAQLQMQVNQYKQESADATSAINGAQQLQSKESQSLQRALNDRTYSLNNLTRMIDALTSKGGSFLQTTATSIQKLALTMDLTAQDRDTISAFFSSGESTPADVLPVLESMKQDVLADIQNLRNQQNISTQELQSLVAATTRASSASLQAYQGKLSRLTELNLELNKLTEQLSSAQASLNQNRQMLANVTSMFQSKQQAQTGLSANYDSQLNAISMLSTVLKQITPQTSLLQATEPHHSSHVALIAKAPIKAAVHEDTSLDDDDEDDDDLQDPLSFIQRHRRGTHHRRGESHSRSVAFIDLALNGESRGFDQIMMHIDKMASILDAQTKQDTSQVSYCKEKTAKAQAQATQTKSQTANLQSMISSIQISVNDLQKDLNTLQATVTALDGEVAKATTVRQTENNATTANLAATQQAISLLNTAQNQILSSMGSSNQGLSDQVTQAVQTVKDLMTSEMTTVNANEATAQTSYQTFVKLSNAKKELQVAAIKAKTANLADLNASLQQYQSSLTAQMRAQDTLTKELKALCEQCSSLLEQLDVRVDARDDQKDSLLAAKQVLASLTR